MKRYFITITDTFGNNRQMLVTKKELKVIKKYNPELIIEVNYELAGKFSYEE